MFVFNMCPSDDSRLEKELCRKSEMYWKKWMEIKSKAIFVMNHRYKIAYPEFEAEISEHGFQCVKVINAILPEKILVLLNEHEILVLLIACYVHDIGLVSNKKPYVPLPHKEHFTNGGRFIFDEDWIDIHMVEKQALSFIIQNHNIIYSKKRCTKNAPLVLEINQKIIRYNFLTSLLQISDLYHHVMDVEWPGLKELVD